MQEIKGNSDLFVFLIFSLVIKPCKTPGVTFVCAEESSLVDWNLSDTFNETSLVRCLNSQRCVQVSVINCCDQWPQMHR